VIIQNCFGYERFVMSSNRFEQPVMIFRSEEWTIGYISVQHPVSVGHRRGLADRIR
jgi:hypothetical protein